MKPPEIEYFITEIPLAIENPRVHGQNLLEISRIFSKISIAIVHLTHVAREFITYGEKIHRKTLLTVAKMKKIFCRIY